MTTEERVDRLERRNRQLLIALIGMVGVGVMAVFLAGRMATAQVGAETVEEVRTKKLLIVDDGGHVRVALGVTEDVSWLELYNANGKSIWSAP